MTVPYYTLAIAFVLQVGRLIEEHFQFSLSDLFDASVGARSEGSR